MQAKHSGDEERPGARLLDARRSRDSSWGPDDIELQDPLGRENHSRPTTEPHRRLSSRFRLRNWSEYALLLLPSFLTYELRGRPASASPAGQWYPTAFMDGLRGVACLAVFNDHLMNLLVKWGPDGWGHNDEDVRFWQLPIVRLLFGGHLAVMVFFIISGFALSVSTVKLMQAERRDPGAFARVLTSSIFRRPLRLFLPVWASTIPVFLCLRLGVFAAVDPMRSNDILEGWPRYHPLNDTLGLQVLDLVHENTRMLNIFRPDIHSDMANRYNDPAWTIPVEFRASLILFITHAATFNLRRRFRLLALACANLYALTYSQSELPLFWIGYMFAEWFFASPPSATPQDKVTTTLTRPRPAWTILGLVIFFVGLWVGSYPVWEGSITPGYVWLARLAPGFQHSPLNWWHIVAAICIVGVLVRCPAASDSAPPPRGFAARVKCLPHAFLSSPVCRYLGKISYGLYLTHALVVNTFGIVFFYRVWSFTGKDSELRCAVGFVFAYALLLCFVIWTADLFWRFVDQPCVRFARWLERKCSVV